MFFGVMKCCSGTDLSGSDSLGFVVKWTSAEGVTLWLELKPETELLVINFEAILE